MRGLLCKKCSECKEHQYNRIDTKGRHIKFKYCEGNKHLVALSDWYFEKDGYCYSTKRLWGTKRFLHTFYKSKRDNDLVIDHINGNRSDNRLCNLRQVSQDINCQNKHNERSSDFPGVFYNKRTKKWVCVVCKGNGETYSQKHIGTYATEEEAYHNYVKNLHADGRKVDVDSKHHKKYLRWLNAKEQATLV